MYLITCCRETQTVLNKEAVVPYRTELCQISIPLFGTIFTILTTECPRTGVAPSHTRKCPGTPFGKPDILSAGQSLHSGDKAANTVT